MRGRFAGPEFADYFELRRRREVLNKSMPRSPRLPQAAAELVRDPATLHPQPPVLLASPALVAVTTEPLVPPLKQYFTPPMLLM